MDSACAIALSKTSSHTDGDHVPAASPTSEVALPIVINDDDVQKKSLLFRLPGNWIIVGWAVIVLSLGLLTFIFPCTDVQEQDLSQACLAYILILISELCIWIPICINMSPPDKGHLEKAKYALTVSFVILNYVSNILELIISSILNSKYGKFSIVMNLFCGVLSFLIISALCWLTIDVEKRDSHEWIHLPLGCNAVLSATLINISVFQLIIKKTFLRFPLFAILKGVINLIDVIIKVVHKKDIA